MHLLRLSDAPGQYVIAKAGFGRERFYSVISQGVTARAVWVESIDLAERFGSFEDAQHDIDQNRDGLGASRAYVRKVPR